MDVKRIKELIKLVSESDVAEIEVEEGGVKVIVRKDTAVIAVQPPPYYPMPVQGMSAQPAAVPMQAAAPAPAAPAGGSTDQPAAAAPATSGKEVKAPIVGTYYSAPSPEADSFVKVGDTVGVGDTLCIIEAMKLMNEIEAEFAGTIKELLIENGTPVQYDQPLFIIDPA